MLKRNIKKIICLIVLLPALSFAQDSVSVYADSVEIDYNFIDSYPQNASVYLNDEHIGNTPLFFMWKDSTFPKQLKINLKGFPEISEIIQSNKTLKMKYNLNPVNSKLINDIVKEDKEPYFKTKRKVVPIVLSSILAAGSGIAAFYFKSQASENQKNYDIFGDPAELEKKKDNNLLGGISIVAFQIGFGALMYFLFLD